MGYHFPVAISNCFERHGWTPNREYYYHFESQVLTGIPEIRADQHGGVHFACDLRIQTDGNSTLLIRFENVELFSINGNIKLTQSGRLVKDSTMDNLKKVSEEFWVFLNSEIVLISFDKKITVLETIESLEKPFIVDVHRGVIQSIELAENESESISNLRRAFLSLIQLNIRGGRVDFNATHAEANLDHGERSYYKIK